LFDGLFLSRRVARFAFPGVQERSRTAPGTKAHPQVGNSEETMKAFFVDVFYPQVTPAHAAYQSTRVEASNMGLGVMRALKTIKQRPALKGKRIGEAKITVREIQKSDVLQS
jgi:hypothetical protein